MRNERRRSAGYGRNLAIAATAVAVLSVAGFWPKAEATPATAQELATLLASPMGEYRKAQLIEQLRRLGANSSDARTRLAALATGSGDDRLACLALRAIARHGGSAARSTIESVYEDTGRSDLVRGMALVVWCGMKADGGGSWSSCRQWVRNHAGSNQFLRDQYAASRAKHWPSEEVWCVTNLLPLRGRDQG